MRKDPNRTRRTSLDERVVEAGGTDGRRRPVNGVRQREGADFTRRGDDLVFPRQLENEGRLGFWRWTSLFLGVAGTYRKNDIVDIVYEVNGKRTVRTGLPIVPDEPMTGQA